MPTHTLPLTIEPDPDDPECAMVLVAGAVDGEPTEFIVDTGAGRTHLVRDEMELTSPRSEPTTGLFATGESRLADIDRLTLGGLEVEGLRVAVSSPGPSHNLLGMDVLGRFRCTFRFKDAELTVTDDGHADADNELVIGERGHVYLKVELEGAVTHACWDSGAGITLVDARFATAHPSLFSNQTTSTGTDVTGACMETPTFTMSGLTVGGHRFADHLVAVTDLRRAANPGDPRIDLILGYPTLGQVDWILDFPTRRWSLRP